MATTAFVSLLLAFAPPGGAAAPAVNKAIEAIDAGAVREPVEFLASDALEGRGTPSRGLDLAAQFIAERMQAAGFAPAVRAATGDSKASFVQEGRWNTGDFDPAKSSIQVGSNVLAGSDFTARLPLVLEPLDRVPFRIVTDALPPAEQARGVVLVLIEAAAAARTSEATRLAPRAVISATEPSRDARPERARGRCPVVFASHEKLAKLFDGAPTGADATLSLTLESTGSATVKNVCGILEGSEHPDEVVMVTAHYDHLGKGKAVNGDAIYNGADDDASGVASMLTIARTLGAAAKAGARAKRSVLCVAFFGEERGLIGSSFYATHPVVPAAKTIADVNIEMVGRPDEIQKNEAWVTGFPLSTFGEIIAAAGKDAGIRFYERDQLSAMLFSQSDNLPLARIGIPAHSISAGSLHKDYHQPSDEIDTLDYANMAAVTRGIAAATFALADGDRVPEWTDKGEDAGYSRKSD